METEHTPLAGEPTVPWRRFLIALYAPPVALIAVFAAVVWSTGIPDAVLLRDPAAVANAPFYIGIGSNLGLGVWAAAAALVFFAAAMIGPDPARREERKFLLWSGLLTVGLLIDDTMMIHDQIYPDLLHLPGPSAYIIHLTAALIYVRRFRGELFRKDRWLLLAAPAFAAVSLMFDLSWPLYRVFHRTIIPADHLAEEGLKLLAMVTWMGYLARRAADAVGKGGAARLAVIGQREASGAADLAASADPEAA